MNDLNRTFWPLKTTLLTLLTKMFFMFEADSKNYISIDTLTDQDQAVDIPTEFLNSLSLLASHLTNLI